MAKSLSSNRNKKSQRISLAVQSPYLLYIAQFIFIGLANSAFNIQIQHLIFKVGYQK